jgi:argininosuccinate lyase
MKKPWGGRFKEKTDRVVEEFTSSISFDKRLYKYDILGSIVHCKMLAKQGIIQNDDSIKIIKALKEIEEEIENRKFVFREECEDIHMNIEKRLVEKIGEIGGRLHTARSRNDQIALDMRLYIKDKIDNIKELIKKLIDTLSKLIDKDGNIIMPGYTHLQRAQPIYLSQHLSAYIEMFDRDIERFDDSLKRADVMPLGACALAGTTFPIDRKYVAKELGFKKIARNSMDAVSDRDFVIEFIFNTSILMMHLSRFSEDLIIWSTKEFGFIELPDSFCTGSSIMPQKKNPDVLELIRGKCGRVYGNLISILTVIKSLPMAYNRDMQEDKEPLFDSVDTAIKSLTVFEKLLRDIRFNRERMNKASREGFTLATDLADYLVRKGIPFRNAHEIVGNIVRYCIDNNKEIEDLSLEELKRFSNSFKDDIYDILDMEKNIRKRLMI